jgi:hypothetical protein
MNKDKRTGWLGNLKVGDNVFVRSDFSLKLGRVSKITPIGRITVFNFLSYGESRKWIFCYSA